MKRAVALIGTFGLLLAPAIAGAQPVAAGSTISVTAVGGFLGLREGFCEDPGGLYDWPHQNDADPKRHAYLELAPCPPETGGASSSSRWVGGILGAARFNSARDHKGDWLVITGNTLPLKQPADFRARLDALHPTLVALGSEDIVRLAAATSTPEPVVSFVRDGTSLPVLATNVAIRRTKPGMNVVKVGPYQLHVDADTTIGWNDKLVLHYSGPLPDATLQESPVCAPPGTDPPGTTHKVTFDTPNDGDAPLINTQGLKPGRCYLLKLTVGSEVFRLSFQSDDALTPRLARGKPALDGFPVVVTSDPRFASQIGVALVDPAVRDRMPAADWKWSAAGTDYELVVTDPEDALEQVVARAADAATSLITVSSMSDAATLKILNSRPEIRVIVLSPDSTILGRAADRVEPPKKDDTKTAAGLPTPSTTTPTDDKALTRYSGDLAFSAIVDAAYPVATRIMLRPEWFGETMIDALASVTIPGSGPAEIRAANTSLFVVPGAELSWTAGALVDYAARFDGEPPVPLARARPYETCTSPRRCADFIGLWADDKTVAAMAAKALRGTLNADIVALPTQAVDTDFRSWVQRRIEVDHTVDWISAFIMHHVFFDNRRMVRAFVAGSDLPDTLTSLAKEEGICFIGLGGDCVEPNKDHPDQILINQRPIDGRLYYALVVPDVLAEKLKLRHDDESRAVGIVEAADGYLASGDWYAAPDTLSDPNPLVERQRRDERRRYRGYGLFTTADFGYSVVDPAEGSVPGTIADFPDAKPSTTWTASVDGEVSFLDGAQWAVRAPLHVDYSEKRQEASRSYDSDEFSLGAQLDRKFMPAVLGDLRLFGGVFVDGPLRDHVKQLTAVADITNPPSALTKVSQTAPFTTTLRVQPSRYRQVAVGTEVLGLQKHTLGNWTFEVTRLAGRVGWGHETRVPTGVTIGGDQMALESYVRDGPGTLLNTYYQNHLGTFAADTAFQIDTVKLARWRAQGDVDGAVSFKHDDKEIKLTVTARGRYYYAPNDTVTLEPRTTAKVELKLDVPVWRRLSVSPDYVAQWATIAAQTSPNSFFYQSLAVKVSFPLVIRWGRGNLIE